MAELALRIESHAADRVAEQQALAAYFPSDVAQWNKLPVLPQAQQSAIIDLPTLHLNDNKLNVYDSYSVNSDVAQLYTKNRPAIVRINTMDPKEDASFSTSAGSGSIIDSSGIIATGYHVIKNAGALRVKTSDGKIYDAKILDVDAAKDQALIQIKSANPFAQFPTVKIASDSSIATNKEQLVALGFPRNQDAMHLSVLSANDRIPLSTLKITGGLLLGEDQNRTIIKADGPVQNGNSGGPAFDLNTGEQIGIVNMNDNTDTYITPIEDLQQFMAKTKAKYGINSLPVNLRFENPLSSSDTTARPNSSPFSSPFGSTITYGSGLQNLDRALNK